MNKLTISLVSTLALVACMLTSCKTTEANWADSYNVAVQKKKDNSQRDAATTRFIDREAAQVRTKVINGDTVQFNIINVNVVDAPQEYLPLCSVIVAEFKQVFNARSLCDRIKEADSKASPYILMDGQRMYYVAYCGFRTREEAATFIKKPKNIKLKVPKKPWILQRP